MSPFYSIVLFSFRSQTMEKEDGGEKGKGFVKKNSPETIEERKRRKNKERGETEDERTVRKARERVERKSGDNSRRKDAEGERGRKKERYKVSDKRNDAKYDQMKKLDEEKENIDPAANKKTAEYSKYDSEVEQRRKIQAEDSEAEDDVILSGRKQPVRTVKRKVEYQEESDVPILKKRNKAKVCLPFILLGVFKSKKIFEVQPNSKFW